MSHNMSYGLREPTWDELRATFGSLQRAYDRSGGHVSTLCYLIANPDRIVDGEPVRGHWSNGEYAQRLAKAAMDESVIEAWRAQEKPTLVATCRATGLGRTLVRRTLRRAGLANNRMRAKV